MSSLPQMPSSSHGQALSLNKPKVSVIIPFFNASAYLRRCLESVSAQKDIDLNSVELILFDDASGDDSFSLASQLQPELSRHFLGVHLLQTVTMHRKLGCGSARNEACTRATGDIFIFQDADDIMHPLRIARSLQALEEKSGKMLKSHVIGGRFERIPKGSTPRYENYHHHLTTEDFDSHAFRDAPIPMPTVACHAFVWEHVKFVSGTGRPEDLHFLYDCMRHGFHITKLLGECLVRYRFHDEMTSLSLSRLTLLQVRVKAFEDLVVMKRPGWDVGFSIWGAGRDGKDVYNALSEYGKNKVTMWGDIDPRKIGQKLRGKPVVHFSKLVSPIACCVALDREGKEFEANLATLQLKAGRDYVHLI